MSIFSTIRYISKAFPDFISKKPSAAEDGKSINAQSSHTQKLITVGAMVVPIASGCTTIKSEIPLLTDAERDEIPFEVPPYLVHEERDENGVIVEMGATGFTVKNDGKCVLVRDHRGLTHEVWFSKINQERWLVEVFDLQTSSSPGSLGEPSKSRPALYGAIELKDPEKLWPAVWITLDPDKIADDKRLTHIARFMTTKADREQNKKEGQLYVDDSIFFSELAVRRARATILKVLKDHFSTAKADWSEVDDLISESWVSRDEKLVAAIWRTARDKRSKSK